MQEFNTVLESSNLTMETLKGLVSENPWMQDPFYKIPKTKDYVGQAANFVHHIVSARV
jgi:hypothetical protein